MDEELASLELELSALRPRRPSLQLERRVASSQSAPPAIRFPEWNWPALSGAAAAAIVCLVAMYHLNASISAAHPAITATFKPVSAENVLLASRDEGYVTLADGTTGRRTREMYVDKITWRNPRTHASLTWSVPREEVRVTPVAFQ